MAAPWVKYNEVQLTFGSSVKQWNQLAVEAIIFASHIAPDLPSILPAREVCGLGKTLVAFLNWTYGFS